MSDINVTEKIQNAPGRLKVKLAGITLDNPVIPASGTFGYGKEFADLYDLDILGSISFKGTTVEKRYGNPLPRIADCTAGMLNSVGLQNPGMDAVCSDELAEMAKIFHKPLIANISGFAADEYVRLAEAMDKEPQVGIIEVNISCPNVHNGGMAFGTDPDNAAAITRAVKSATSKPVFTKLSPNVTDITEIARACEDAGADGLSLINTILGMRIDIRKRQPVLANKVGGFSGPAIFPIALRMVWQVAHAVDVPVMGMGGISSAEDVIEMMMAGATAVQVGAANLRDPFSCKKIIRDLPRVMDDLGIERLEDIIGIIE
jgi:dihydroorotate dehydrogenase (NAD+) catalytic subunit